MSYRPKSSTQPGGNNAAAPATQPGKFATQPGKISTQPGKFLTQPGKFATQPGKNGAATPIKSTKQPHYQHQPQRGVWVVVVDRSFWATDLLLLPRPERKIPCGARCTGIGRPIPCRLISCLLLGHVSFVGPHITKGTCSEAWMDSRVDPGWSAAQPQDGRREGRISGAVRPPGVRRRCCRWGFTGMVTV